MKSLLSPMIAATLAASFAIAAIPANAQPVYVPGAGQARTDAEPVSWRDWRWRQERWAERRAWRRHAWRERCWRWGDCPDYRDRYYGYRRDRYDGYRDGYYGFSPRYHHRRDYYRQGGVTLEFQF